MLKVHEEEKPLEAANRILTRDEIHEILAAALIEKLPLPPAGWSASLLDEELLQATKEFELDPLLRQQDALRTSLVYLVDYALRMPEWIDLTQNNGRVKEMCEELALGIEQITLEPQQVVNKHGKLKSRIKTILAVHTCIIYCEETERCIAEQEEAKRLARLENARNTSPPGERKAKEKRQSEKARTILPRTSRPLSDKQSDQPRLF